MARTSRSPATPSGCGSITSGSADLEAQAEANLRQRQSPTEPTGEPTAAGTCSATSATTAAPSSSTPSAGRSGTRRSSSCSGGGSRTTTARRARRADFIALAEEIAGEQLDEFFDAWLLRRRPPARIIPESRRPASQGGEQGGATGRPARASARTRLGRIGATGDAEPGVDPEPAQRLRLHLRDRCPTQGSSIRSVARPVIRSARVRPARLVVATPSPT